MKQFITGQISTSSLVNISTVYPDSSGVDSPLIKSNTAQISGISESDLSVLEITDQATIDRIQARDSFTLVFTGLDLTSLDFSPEESKLFVKISVDKNSIAADGSDTATISVEIWKADMSGIATGITASRLLDVLSSFYGSVKHAVQINSGVGSIPFSTTIPGTWKFPANPDRYDNFRVDGQVIITSYLG